MYHVPEQFRNRKAEEVIYHGVPMAPGHGYFQLPSLSAPKTSLVVVAANDLGWEHVSVSARHNKKVRIPTWEEMCQIKDIFWDDEDVVVQYHPKKSEYVSNYPVLHLWRPTEVGMPTPPAIMVGIPGADRLDPDDALDFLRAAGLGR